MKKYSLIKNGIITNMWDSTTGDEAYYEPGFGDPSTYQITIEDTTAQDAEEVELKKRAGLKSHGSQIQDFIIYLNTQKYTKGELTMADLLAMETYSPLLLIEKQLERGTLSTAKYSLQNYLGPYYNQADINSIIQKINKALGI